MISRSTMMPVWLRFALRELRGGLSGFRIFMACLILGVMALAAVGSLTQAIERGLAEQGQVILGGDVEVSLFQREATADQQAFLQSFGQLSTSARLCTMARTEGGDSTLVELRAVDTAYPLYGTLETRPVQDNQALFDKRLDTYGAAIDPLLADRLGLALGDRLLLGSLSFDIRAFIEREPDKANQGFQLGPTVMIRRTALDATGLVTTGSLITHAYKIKTPLEVKPVAVVETIKSAYPDETWRTRDRSGSAPGLRRFIERMGMFLTLVGLTALVVGGLGVGNAVTGYMDRKTRTIATLKILGAQGSTIFRVYFAQVILLGLLAIIMGLTAGAFLPGLLANFLPDSLPISPEEGLYPKALVLAAAYGLLITVAFTAWPLGRARDLPAARLFRALVAPEKRNPRTVYILLIIAAVALVAVLAVGLSGNMMLSAGFLGGAIIALALLRLTSWGVQEAASALPRSKNPLMRMAVANLHRPGAATSSVVISLGLGLTLFATLALIEGNLESQLRDNVPSEAPAFFFLDIQPHERESFGAAAGALDGVSDYVNVPSLRGRILQLNDTPAKEIEADPEYRWILNGDRGLSYAKTLPKGSRVVEGDWWPEDYSGPPEISFGKLEAEGLGLKIGDTVTMSVLGREISATIRSLREIQWDSMGFNFVILFDPNTLKNAPHTYMATLKATGAAEQAAHRSLTRAFPGVTAVRMKEVLGSINNMLNQIGVAVRATAVVAIVAGVFVLAGAIAAGFRQRLYESVIMKVVGAVRSQILRAYIMEYLFLGLITALIALGLGTLAGWAVVDLVMDMDFQLLPVPMAITVTVSLFVTLLFGMASSSKALAARPNTVLRTE